MIANGATVESPVNGPTRASTGAVSNGHTSTSTAVGATGTGQGDDVATRPGTETLAGAVASPLFLCRIDIGFARRHGLIGLESGEGRLRIAMLSADSLVAADAVGRLLDIAIEPVLLEGGEAAAERLQTLINESYQAQEGRAAAMLETIDRGAVLDEVEVLAAREDLLDVADRAPVIRLVNLMLFEAVKLRASDVHVQPYEGQLVVRMRIDGQLEDVLTIPKTLQEEVVSRIKVMGRMNIAEKRLPQDGRAAVEIGSRRIDLRIASLPTSHGERAVIRLLDKSAGLLTLEELGMDAAALVRFRRLIAIEHGIVLVTGPTGSGKTTTLYAALRELNRTERNVLTLEDPIEYELEGISQTQINEKKGMTFASGLRSVLRQDPDIIMLGEIRDRETAVMAIQSALTGHLVFSTLHTNDAASAITRLLDLGIEPYLVSSSVVGVLAQRLVRRNCPRCAAQRELTDSERAWLTREEAKSLERPTAGAGCDACRHTGYRGRVGLFEHLDIESGVRTMIQNRASADAIKEAAVSAGMSPLRDCGIARIREGRTTVEEVQRVTIRAREEG